MSRTIDSLFTVKSASATPLHIIQKWDEIELTELQKNMLGTKISQNLTKNQFFTLPNGRGNIALAAVGFNNEEPFFTLGEAYKKLPEGRYKLTGDFANETLFQHLFAFGLGAYQFDKYKKSPKKEIQFVVSEQLFKRLKHALHAHYLVRDLINEPPNVMTPDNLATAIRAEFRNYDARFNVEISEIVGSDLLKQNFPLIYTVGAGSKYNPRLIEITAGNPEHPALTLVGKGVTFDTGGLDIKPSSGMRLMKKDMGGAAHMVALAKWILDEELPLSLRLLLPIVENSVSDGSMRPGDIVKARNGSTVEIDNTDAEGRLILADALTYAAEKPCDLLLNFATLTGAARVALGPEIPALFSNDENFTQTIFTASQTENDLVWPLPLHQPYQAWIEPSVADIANSATVPTGGAITAALFLKHFIGQAKFPFAHIDVMAWNIRNRPGRPEGGEAMGLRAAFSAIKQHFNL